MIKINFDKVEEALRSEEFKEKICEACAQSTLRHASELYKAEDGIDDFEYNVRSDLVLLRLMSLIAERVCDGLDDEDNIEPKMTFIFNKSEYLFELLTKIISADELLERVKGKID